MQPMTRKGFTLIELLVTIVIVGILAAFAIPKFWGSKEKATLASMQSDLRSVLTSQETYLAANNTYYSGALPSRAMTFAPSPGNSIRLGNVTQTGWAGIVTNPSTTWTCAVYVGTGGPVAPATTEGVIACSAPAPARRR